MSTVLTETSSFDGVVVPQQTDGFALAGIVAALQNLTNRGRWLRDNGLVHGDTFTFGKTINAGAQALTLTGGAGNTNITRTTGTVNISGAGAASLTSAASTSVTATSTGTLNVSTTNGPLTVTCGGANDLTIASGQDLILSPAGVCTVPAAKLTVTGAGYPARQAQAFSNVGIRWAPQLTSASFAADVTNPGRLTHSVAGLETATLQLFLTPGSTYTSFTVRYRGPDVASLPTGLDAFQVFECLSETTTSLSALVTDPTASLATYKSFHDVVVTLTTSLRPVSGRRYFLTWRTANGVGTISTFFAQVVNVGATGSTDTFGVGLEP